MTSHNQVPTPIEKLINNLAQSIHGSLTSASATEFIALAVDAYNRPAGDRDTLGDNFARANGMTGARFSQPSAARGRRFARGGIINEIVPADNPPEQLGGQVSHAWSCRCDLNPVGNREPAEEARPHTPPLHDPATGRTTITVQRFCNRCGRHLGDATEKELDACVNGTPLPDVHDECECASSPIASAPSGIGASVTIPKPYMLHLGPHDTVALAYRRAAEDLERGNDIGGSNRRDSIARVLHDIADVLFTAAVRDKPKDSE